MLDGDVGYAIEVGDGAGDLEDAVVGACAEALLLHGALQQAFGVGGEIAEGADLLGVHLRVGEDGLGGGLQCGFAVFGLTIQRDGEADVLAFAGLQDAGGVPAESRLRDNLKAKPKLGNSSYQWMRNRGQVIW